MLSGVMTADSLCFIVERCHVVATIATRRCLLADIGCYCIILAFNLIKSDKLALMSTEAVEVNNEAIITESLRLNRDPFLKHRLDLTVID